MSHLELVDIEGSNPQIPTQFDANTGSAVPIANTLNILGDNVHITTSASGNTVTITLGPTVGTVTSFSFSNANGFTGVVTNPTTTPNLTINTTVASADIFYSVSGAPTGSTNFQWVAATNSLSLQGTIGTANQVVTSGGAGQPSAYASVGSLGAITSITGNSGGAEVPAAGGNFNILGTGSITAVGSANTETIQLTGLTNHNLLLGAGTATITNVPPSATAGVPFVSNGAAADGSFSTALIPGGGTATTSFNINGAVFSGTTTTSALAAATLTSGQLLIGGTTTPAAATLTAGTGVSITNGNNSITINAIGGGNTWIDVTGTTQTVSASHGYLSDNAGTVTFTLPASSTVGDVFEIVGVQGAWVLAQNSGQQVKIGSAATTVGATGSLASTNAGDSIALVATNTSASSVWRVKSSIGNITVT